MESSSQRQLYALGQKLAATVLSQKYMEYRM